jgi:hypothetical protein
LNRRLARRCGPLAAGLLILSCSSEVPSAVLPTQQGSATRSTEVQDQPAVASPHGRQPSASSSVLIVPEEGSTLRTLGVAPQQTDTGADTPTDPHLVAFDPAAAPRGQLFLFLSGASVTPEQTALIVAQAAANGFHAIGLSYPNAVPVGELCETNAEEACFESIRLEVIDGVDRTPLVEVTQANSIANRLAKLLNYLGMRFPGEGWPSYLESGAPRWSAIRVGGHSQGGGNAAIIARDYEVARVCLIESPMDVISMPGGTRRLPPWIGSAQATPTERYYGFRHLRSSSPSAEAVPLAWSAIGLDQFGAGVDVGSVQPPYDGSHQLTTNADPVNDGMPDLPSRSLAVDSATPRSPGGQPFFAPAWQYACFS